MEFRANSQIHLSSSNTNGIYKFFNGLSLKKVDAKYQYRNSYPYHFQILHKDNVLGMFYTKTLDLSLSDGLNTMVRIDNKMFYVDNIDRVLKVIVEALGLDNLTIHRLDICYDTAEDVLTKFKKLFYDTSTEFKRENVLPVANTGMKDKTVIIGGLRSKTKCIAIYNKTLELNHSHKEYIRNTHIKTFGYINIYRVEVRILNRLYNIKDIDIMKLNRLEYLECVFHTYFDTLVNFIDKNTNERIEFITLYNTSKKLELSAKKKIKCGGKKVKEVINFMDKEIKTTKFRGVRKLWYVLRLVLLEKYGLKTWYLLKKQG